jgi:integrase
VRHRWLLRRRGERDLRHTHANQLLQADAQGKEVSERLGHALIGMIERRDMGTSAGVA